MRINKEWNEKYLSGIESISNRHLITPLKNIPKKYKVSFWKKLITSVLVGSVLFSFGFAALNHAYECWLYEWFSNLFLNLSLGMIASLILLLYTDRKEKNINFYEKNLELLKNRYEQLHNAFSASFGVIRKDISFNRMKEATDDAFNSFECFFCTINFFEFLFKALDYIPKQFGDITKEKIEKAKKDSIELYQELESKIDSDGNLSIEDLSRVERNGDIIFSLLNNFRLWIDMTEDNLYGTMYRKTKKEKNNVIGGDRR